MAHRHQKQNIFSTKPKPIQIDSLAHDGRGVGRDENGKVVFIDGALPNEKVLYTITASQKNYSQGSVNKVLTPAPERVSPQCSIFAKCGGCALQHLNSNQQIIFKQQQLIRNLQKIAEVEPEVVFKPIVAESWAYRRRARFGAIYAPTKGEVRLGFRAKNSHFIQPNQHCDILDLRITELLPSLKLTLSKLRSKEDITGVEICVADNAIAIIVFYSGLMPDTDKHQLIEYAQNYKPSKQQINYGLQLSTKSTANKGRKKANNKEHLLYSTSTRSLHYSLKAFKIILEFSASDFTQVNVKMNELLVSRALQLLDIQPQDNVLDLFCGLGNFTLPIARLARHVVGVEGSETLITQANQNKALNTIDNADFYTVNLFDESLFTSINTQHDNQLTQQQLPQPQQRSWFNKTYDKILLDPPRAGAIQLINVIERFKASRIIYVSCDHATLARDTKLLNEKGYQLTGAGVADMFPQTSHVESIAVFDKK